MDVIDREVMRHRLLSITNEMSDLLRRSAYSPSITEIRDYSNAIHLTNGDAVAQAPGIPIFLGAMPESMRAAIERFSIDGFRPGDAVISNDPFLAGGTHLNDVNVMMPVFIDSEVRFFLQSKAHWRDIGAKDSGSWCPDATQIYQEGLRMPPIKICRDNNLDEGIWDMIAANVRLPESTRGDLAAQLAACRAGVRRLEELVDHMGWERVQELMQDILDHGDRAVRERIASLPDGEYTSQIELDSDGIHDDPFFLAGTVSVRGDRMVVDLRDCPTQRRGGAGNTVRAASVSAARMALQCLVGDDIPANDGCYRALEVHTTPGTVVDAQDPAPVTVGLGEICLAVIEIVLRAVAPAVPERAIAGFFGAVSVLNLVGHLEGCSASVFGGPNGGGWGAVADHDGVSAFQTPVNGDCANLPAEVIETLYPLRVERQELRVDSGGAGRTRGGLGMRVDYRILGRDASMNVGLTRWRKGAPGLFGGTPGAVSATVVEQNGERAVLHLASGFPLEQGALVSHQTGGGGGFGPAEDRPLDRIAGDLVDSYVTVDEVGRRYPRFFDSSTAGENQ